MKDCLSIVTVHYQQPEILAYNYRVACSLNDERSFNWIVVDNSAAKELTSFGQSMVVIKGTENTYANVKGGGSYHHAAGIQIGLKNIKTRFLLILDPDFFIVMPSWIETVKNHLVSAKLCFFGSTWNPLDYLKYRYFPSVHCLFVDTHRVAVDELDFTPDLEFTNMFKSRLKRFALPSSIRERLLVGASRDTGYKIYKKYHARLFVKSATLSPVVKEESFEAYQRNRSGVRKCIPDFLSLLPQKKGYLSKNGFLQVNSGTSSVGEWEQFLFKNRPFGFHLRSFGRSIGQNLNNENDVLKKVLTEHTNVAFDR